MIVAIGNQLFKYIIIYCYLILVGFDLLNDITIWVRRLNFNLIYGYRYFFMHAREISCLSEFFLLSNHHFLLRSLTTPAALN